VLSVQGWTFEELPAGTELGTGSPRRRAQLLHARPDLRTVPVRGNVDTRVRKLGEGRFGALVLALAGIERLGMDRVPVRPVAPSVCLPAVGQGALAVETREADRELIDLVRALEDPPSRWAVDAERAFLCRLGGGCLAPATAYGRAEQGELRLEAAVGDQDGKRLIRDLEAGPVSRREELGERLAARMLEAGAAELLALSREPDEHDGAA
jgi:hydroxymethylbilane synthase